MIPITKKCWEDLVIQIIIEIKKNVVFWDVALYRFCVNRRFGGTYRLHIQGRKIREREPERQHPTGCSLSESPKVQEGMLCQL
jgi:hypothetical protein